MSSQRLLKRRHLRSKDAERRPVCAMDVNSGRIGSKKTSFERKVLNSYKMFYLNIWKK